MLQVSAAVAAAHEAGIIHRDLKPANIFIVQHSEVPAVVKVLDFGIAKLAADSLDDDDHKTLTQVGAMIGTPRYMSPEQCNGEDLTPAADVYSLGVILYELLTGTVPFSGTSPLAIAVKHTSETPRSPREFVSSIPEALEKIVLRTLEKRPEDRPANAAEFRKELLETAERLGFEHASVASSPNLEALRSVGTESPSGRLIIDISRLRESRAVNTDVNEVTVLAPGQYARLPEGDGSHRPVQRRNDNHSFPKVSVPLIGYKSKKQFIVVAAIIAAMLLTGAGLVVRSRNAQATGPNAIAGPTPDPGASPTASVSPSPSPSPSPSAKPAARRAAKPRPQKDSSFGGKFKRGVKKIFNPF
jgi:serine/threonine-protein kinase